MHKKYFNFILPILGAGLVIGSGFAAWVFQGEVSSNLGVIGGIDIKPEAAFEVGGDTSVHSFNVNLDQGGVRNTDPTVGITMDYAETVGETTTEHKSEPLLKTNVTFILRSTALVDWTAMVETSYAVNLKISPELGNYVKAASLEASQLTPTPREGTDMISTDTVTYTGTVEFGLMYTDYKPTNHEEYETMKSFLTDKTNTVKLNIAFTATLK